MKRSAVTLAMHLTLCFCAVPLFSQNENKAAVLWCDPLKNFEQITTRDGIISLLDQAKDSGFRGIALVVKTNSGEVIYKNGKLAPRLLEWKGARLTIDFDPLQVFLVESKSRNLEIYAVFSVFAEGHLMERRGPIYGNHPDWQSTVYVMDDEEPVLMPITEWSYGPIAFANPVRKDVQNYEVSVINEFIKNYKVDRIIFDKMRFSGIESDFSDYSKQEFQKFLGPAQQLNWWPDDIYELRLVSDELERIPGQYYQEWIEFRAKTMQSFLKLLIDSIRKVDASVPISSFVGAWYPTYYEVGVNWASETNIPEEEWSSRDYYKTAQAEMLDSVIAACFFPRVTIEEAENVNADWWMSIEGSAAVANEVVNRACPVEAAVMVEQFKNNSGLFKKALATALDLDDGLYVYDFSQLEKYDYWGAVKSVLQSTVGQKSTAGRK
ncbi:MAG: alpha amylase family protein [bacterium]